MALFDAYMMVDWSAAAVPRKGKDSIWICLAERVGGDFRLSSLENPATRAAACDRLGDLLASCCKRGLKVLAGFDFPFGYPQGFARALGLNGPPWRAAWDEVVRLISDGDDNANNRFDIGADFNARLGKPGPFWGCPERQARATLTTKRPDAYGKGRLAERRISERYISGPQPVWKLAYTGSVGSQMLMGIPVVSSLRDDERLRAQIWPFETGFRNLDKTMLGDCDVVLAEIYPSLVAPRSTSGAVKDALQVQAMVGYLKARDDAGCLGGLFAGADDLTAPEREAIETEEAWILGVNELGTKAGRIPVAVDGLFSTDALAHV